MGKPLDCSITPEDVKEILWENLLLRKKTFVFGKRIDELDPPEESNAQSPTSNVTTEGVQAKPVRVVKPRKKEGGNGASND